LDVFLIGKDVLGVGIAGTDLASKEEISLGLWELIMGGLNCV
jgi:hypothetical protein